MQAAAGPSVGSPAEGSVPVDDEAGKQEAGSPGSVDTFSLLPPLIVDPSSKPEPGSSPKPEPGSSNGPQTSLASPKPDPTPDPGPDAAPPQPLVYLPLDCLNPYLARVWGSPDGVLPEEDIEVMCEALQAPRLVRHLRELRARHLRKRGAGAGQGGGGQAAATAGAGCGQEEVELAVSPATAATTAATAASPFATAVGEGEEGGAEEAEGQGAATAAATAAGAAAGVAASGMAGLAVHDKAVPTPPSGISVEKGPHDT